LALPLDPSTRLQMVAVDDIGAFIALAFERPGKWQGRTFEIAGDEISMTDLAQMFSRITGTEVVYRQVPWDEFTQKIGPDLCKMWRFFQDPGYHIDISLVRQDYPQSMSFERWLHEKWMPVAKRRVA
jgi:uncharacterized protein YbjT (DUF2867 family)